MKKNKFALYLILPIVFVTLFLQVLMKGGTANKQSKIRLEYPEIEQDSSVFGIVKHTQEYTNSIPKGVLLVALENGIKFNANAAATPAEIKVTKDNITSLFLYNFLTKGDTIYKPPHKDSLYVFKNGTKYTFYYPSKEIIDDILRRNQQ